MWSGEEVRLYFHDVIYWVGTIWQFLNLSYPWTCTKENIPLVHISVRLRKLHHRTVNLVNSTFCYTLNYHTARQQAIFCRTFVLYRWFLCYEFCVLELELVHHKGWKRCEQEVCRLIPEIKIVSTTKEDKHNKSKLVKTYNVVLLIAKVVIQRQLFFKQRIGWVYTTTCRLCSNMQGENFSTLVPEREHLWRCYESSE